MTYPRSQESVAEMGKELNSASSLKVKSHKTTFVLKCIMLCEFYNYNNEFVLFNVMLFLKNSA